MSDLDRVREILLTGDKTGATKMLISMLRDNRDDIDAWLLLSEVVEDSNRKEDCYRAVLRISPYHSSAVRGLMELESSASDLAGTKTNPDPVKEIPLSSTGLSESILHGAKWPQGVGKEQSTEDHNQSMNGISPLATFVASVLVMLVVLAIFIGLSYLIGIILTRGGDASNSISTGGFLLIGIVIVWAIRLVNEERSKQVSNAIRKQRGVGDITPRMHRVGVGGKTVSCRACHYLVSRTSPVCLNCGEPFPGIMSGCPNCQSGNIRISPKGFSLAKAAAGVIIAGPIGLAGGLHGTRDLQVRCAECQSVFTIKQDELA